MRRFLAVALLAVPVTAGAFKVALRDEATGKPVDGGFVIAREWATVGKIHGTDDYCARADIAPASGPVVSMDLPLAGTDMLTAARGLEAIAYRPGYCIARTESAQRIASWKHMSVGAEKPREIDTWGETRLAMRRAGADPEERLLYLREMLPLFMCSRNRWSDRSAKSLELFRESVLSEARMLARTRYEKALVHRLGQEVVIADVRRVPPLQDRPTTSVATVTSYPRDFIIAPENYTAKWSETGVLVAAPPPKPIGNPGLAPGAMGALPMGNRMIVPAGPKPPPPALAILCRHGDASKCDLDERDADGRTAIMGAIDYLHGRTADAQSVAEVKLLLEAGADPTIPARPFGAGPLEVALMSLMSSSPGPARDQLAQIVDLLAAHPRTTLPQALKDDLAADPSTWNIARYHPSLQLVVERREALAKVAARPERPRTCERPATEYDSFFSSSRDERLRLRAAQP